MRDRKCVEKEGEKETCFGNWVDVDSNTGQDKFTHLKRQVRWKIYFKCIFWSRECGEKEVKIDELREETGLENPPARNGTFNTMFCGFFVKCAISSEKVPLKIYFDAHFSPKKYFFRAFDSKGGSMLAWLSKCIFLSFLLGN